VVPNRGNGSEPNEVMVRKVEITDLLRHAASLLKEGDPELALRFPQLAKVAEELAEDAAREEVGSQSPRSAAKVSRRG
jgi:hypothetical protein